MGASNEHSLARLVSRLRMHGPLSDPDAQALTGLPWSFRNVARLAYVAWESEPCDTFHVLVDGYASHHKTTAQGGRQIVSFDLPGDPMGFHCLLFGASEEGVQMLTKGVVASVSADVLGALLLHRRELELALARTAMVDAAIASEWQVSLGRRDGRSRLAHLLCEFSLRLAAQGGDRDSFELPFTQEQIADMTGLTPIHVNRLMQELSREGVIVRDGRSVQIASIEALEEVAGFDPRYLHLGRGADEKAQTAAA